jgi:hypothetical protein
MSVHPSDRDLLLFADQELGPRRTARVQRHLQACTGCRTRTDILTGALAGATQSLSERVIALPSAAAARGRLVDRLAQLNQRPLRNLGVRQWAIACAVVLAMSIGAAWVVGTGSVSMASSNTDSGPRVFLLPDPALTPGLARSVTATETCRAQRAGRTLPVSAAVHHGIFVRYGADLDRSSEYELDYLITPELGGVADARNLWPQPFAGTPWNAYVKDELELHLRELFCEGTIDLTTAQQEIATDWIAAYKRRFNTDKPLRDYATAPLTERDASFLRAELAELGIVPPNDGADGPTLLALLHLARSETAP